MIIQRKHYKLIDSTQKEAWRLYESNKKNILISADIQTNGIGTHGRKWYTEEKNNIAFSLLLTPQSQITKFDGLTIRIGELIKDIFIDEYNINLKIKEPNDLMYNGKKVGGILLQTKIEKGIVKALVIGVGINTNQTKFNNDIKDIATSIKIEFKKDIDTQEFIDQFIKKITKELKGRKII